MTDQPEVRNAQNIKKRHIVVKKKMFVFTGQTTGSCYKKSSKNREKLSLVFGHFLAV